ncbi:MAG: cell division protein ZapD [Gammaproteobacteria bacterium]|nr:cell division protein ZapD [Gammaproteobacteria bacterium]
METASEQIIFEHPLNERTRTLLRFEHLFNQTGYHSLQACDWDSRAAIDGIVDMLNILLSRSDMKSELLKELGRYHAYLTELTTSSGVNRELLDKVLDEITEATTDIQNNIGQIGQELRDNEFLQSILHRSSIPGGNCAFDLPLYHYWLEKPAEDRLLQLNQWLQTLEPIHKAVMLLLSIMRDSTVPTQEHAEEGMFQMALDTQSPARLIRIALPRDTIFFPKVSGSRHRFTIRFMQVEKQIQSIQTKQNIEFQLTCCTI